MQEYAGLSAQFAVPGQEDSKVLKTVVAQETRPQVAVNQLSAQQVAD